MKAIEVVRNARMSDRFTSIDYIHLLIRDFVELHGDRRFGDDPAVIGGIGYFQGIPVTVIGVEKGKDAASRAQRHFGCPLPEGYRKATRLMKEAEKFHRPVLNFVDTAGANADVEAEERGQGEAIADCILTATGLRTPVISLIIGEGGSGGALALSIADRLYMLEESYLGVISPESCSSILFKNPGHAEEAAEELHLRAEDLLEFGVVDGIFPTIKEKNQTTRIRRFMEKAVPQIEQNMRDLLSEDSEKLIAERAERYRKMP